MIVWSEGRRDVASDDDERAADSAHRVCLTLSDVLGGIAEGSLDAARYREEMEARGAGLPAVLDARDLARSRLAERRHGGPIRLGMGDAEINRALNDHRPHPLADVLPLLEGLAEDWSAGLPALQSISARMVDDGEGGRRADFRAHARRAVRHEARAIVNLDASASPLLAAAVWGDRVRIEAVAARRFARVVQVMDEKFSMSAVGLSKTRGMTGAAEHRKRLIVEALRILAAANGPESVGFISYKELVANVAEAVPGIATAHFGALRGLNSMKDARVLVVVGRLRPTAEAMEDQARALARGTGRMLDLPGEYRRDLRGLRMRDGAHLGLAVEVHADPLVHEILEATREREIEQAIDRLRLVRREADPPTVYVLSGEVPDVTVDEVVGARAWLASLAAGADLGAGGAPVIGDRWLRAAAGGWLGQRIDGLPLEDRRLHDLAADAGRHLVSNAVRFRRSDSEVQFPVFNYLPGIALRAVLGGIVLEGERQARSVIVPEHLAADPAAARRHIEAAEGRAVRGLALAAKRVIEMAKSSRMEAMLDDRKAMELQSVARFGKALRDHAAARGFATCEAWISAAGIEAAMPEIVRMIEASQPVAQPAIWRAYLAPMTDACLAAAWQGALARQARAAPGSPEAASAARDMNEIMGLVLDMSAEDALRHLPRTLGVIVEDAEAHPIFAERRVRDLAGVLSAVAAMAPRAAT